MTINTVPATPDIIKECILQLAKNDDLRKIAPYIWGPPGIGKSDIVRQIAKELGWALIDLRLTRMDSTDLTGLPYLHEEKEQTIYYLPEFLPTTEMIEAWGKKGCIIFLDELSAAEPRLQASAYELILDRRIGKYKLPDNVMVVAAGNRIEDGAIAYDLTSALSDRFVHFNAMTSLESWLKWEEQRAKAGRPIVPEIKAFLQASPQFLDEGFAATGVNTDDKINPSPRTWEKTSNIMETVTDERLRKILIPGLVGTATANEFFFVIEEIASLAPMSEYIRLGNLKDDDGIKAILPQKTSGLFGLGYSLPAYCTTEEDFLGACYVFNVLASINDNQPRKEILVTSIISLFLKAQKIDSKDLPRKIGRSAAYKAMRKEHMAAFAEIEDM